MDPQQRLLLAAFAQAGAPFSLGSSRSTSLAQNGALWREWGVYVGVSALDYHRLAARHTQGATAYSATGSLSLSVTSGRVAFAFGLQGPALSVDTGERLHIWLQLEKWVI